jgi:hypothetical protein
MLDLLLLRRHCCCLLLLLLLLLLEIMLQQVQVDEAALRPGRSKRGEGEDRKRSRIVGSRSCCRLHVAEQLLLRGHMLLLLLLDRWQHGHEGWESGQPRGGGEEDWHEKQDDAARRC